jgi:hypothetical protein
MSKKKSNRIVIHPEQRSLMDALLPGDRQKIATMSGYSYHSIRDMVQGMRRMPDEVVVAITELLQTRKQIRESLKATVNGQ